MEEIEKFLTDKITDYESISYSPSVKIALEIYREVLFKVKDVKNNKVKNE